MRREDIRSRSHRGGNHGLGHPLLLRISFILIKLRVLEMIGKVWKGKRKDCDWISGGGLARTGAGWVRT